MKIGFVYLPGRLKRIRARCGTDHRKSKASKPTYHPSEFFYGAFELEQSGHTVELFEVVEKPRRNILKYAAEKLLWKKHLPVKTYPGIIDAAWFLLKDLNKQEVVIATTPGIAFSLAVWKMAGVLKPPIVGIQCGILNYDLDPIRILTTRILHRYMRSQLFGVGELEEIVRIYRLDPETLEVNPFGVDLDFWKPVDDPSIGGYFLSIGNDALRDYATLISAAANFSFPVVIVTKRPINFPIPKNVRIIRGAWNTEELEDDQVRQLYQNALAVAVPLKESRQPSGQSVALQAMACRKTVVLTRTKGLWDAQGLVHGENILFVTPKNVEQWIQIFKTLLGEKDTNRKIAFKARQYVVENGDIRHFASRLEKRCHITMGNLAN